MHPDRIQKIRDVRASVYERGFATCTSGRQFPIMPDGLTVHDADVLRDVVIGAGATSTLEVGFAVGLSGLAMIEGLLHADSDACHHVALDPYQTATYEDAGVELVREAGAEGLFELIQKDSQIAMPAMIEAKRRFDVIFIDGDHAFDSALCDLYFADRLIEPGGTLVVDDIWIPAVQAAVNYFVRHRHYRMVSIDTPERTTYPKPETVREFPIEPGNLNRKVRRDFEQRQARNHVRPWRLAVLEKQKDGRVPWDTFHGFW